MTILHSHKTLTLRLLVNQTNHTCHVTSTHTRDNFFTYKVFFLIEPHWFFICGGKCHKPPINVPYKRTFGVPDQGQTLDVWESQTAESALKDDWPRNVPRHTLEDVLEVILEHVCRIKTMTSLILDHVAKAFLYLGVSVERKISSSLGNVKNWR